MTFDKKKKKKKKDTYNSNVKATHHTTVKHTQEYFWDYCYFISANPKGPSDLMLGAVIESLTKYLQDSQGEALLENLQFTLRDAGSNRTLKNLSFHA